MKAIVTGGGTGGHIYPALAIAKALTKKGWEILYVGSHRGLEGDIVPGEGMEYTEVDVAPLPRKISFKIITALLSTSRGYIQSRGLMKEFMPDIVIGTGGYVAGPVVLAACRKKIPTLIQEQNVYPGFTNRLLARWVTKITLNFEAATEYLPNGTVKKAVVTGNPIRETILKAERKKGLKEFDLSETKKTLLVFGGSQGSMSINNAMEEVYDNYQNSKKIQIIHITGKDNFQNYLEKLQSKGINIKKCNHYKIVPYLKNMELAYAVADLVIYRAGATGISEITAKGIPAILIPYPYAAGNHQEYNARNLEDEGAALMIKDEELNGDKLLDCIEDMLWDNKRLAKMSKNSLRLGHPEALKKIVGLIEEMVV